MIFKKYFWLIACCFFVLAGLFGTGISDTKAMTADEIQARISALMAQIAQLQKQLAEVQGGQEAVWCHDFNVNLKIGDSGNDVEALEYILVKEGFSVTEHSSNFSAVYDEGMASAVTGFQEKYKDEVLAPWRLKYGTGFVGRSTRAKLNKLYGCVATTTPSITVTSPNGGEVWKLGETRRITWTSSGVNNVLIYIYNPTVGTTSGSTNTINPNGSGSPLSATLGYFDWTILENQLPHDNYGYKGSSDKYTIRIDDVDQGTGNVTVRDSSNNYFSIVAATSTATTTPSVCSSTDSDYKDIYTKGITTYNGESKTDYCINTIRLKEYYCDAAMGGARWLEELEYDCPNGCQNGACLATTTTAVITGYCEITDHYTSIPSRDASDIGKGYAKMLKSGVNTISSLQSACSASEYSALLNSYCGSNSNPVQQQVVTYDANGNFLSSSCGGFGCNDVYCPSSTSTATTTAMDSMGEQLASISDAVSWLMQEIKNLVR